MPGKQKKRLFLAPQVRAQLLPASLVFGLPGRNAAERAKKILHRTDDTHRLVFGWCMLTSCQKTKKFNSGRKRFSLNSRSRFRSSNDPAKMKQLGDQLGHFVFGKSQIENVADQDHFGCDCANFATTSLNPWSSLILSNALSSSDLGFVIPFSMAFFNSWMACFFSPSCACAVATR
jgi:hypothetical protein